VDTKIKAATKTVYMYGGRKPCDEKAMKAGGHELKGTALGLDRSAYERAGPAFLSHRLISTCACALTGLEGYFHSEVDELHCPLMVIIGKFVRMHAPALPIAAPSSLLTHIASLPCHAQTLEAID
jgi:hypothetical protein